MRDERSGRDGPGFPQLTGGNSVEFHPESTSEPPPNGQRRAGHALRPRLARFSAPLIAASLLSLGLGASTGWLGTLPAAGAAVTTHDPAEVDSDFAKLMADIAAGPAKLLGGPARKELLFDQAVLAHRRIDTQPGNPCAILPTLARMRAGLVTGTVPGEDNPTVGTPVVSPLLAVQLEADMLDIQTLLLSSGDAVSCGGTSVPSTPAGFPLTKVISSDNTQVTFHVSFPAPVLRKSRRRRPLHAGPFSGDGRRVVDVLPT